jgi:hypothetical protein
MANMLLKVTIAATGTPQQITKSLPSNNLGGNAGFDSANIYVQQLIFQNQGDNDMHIGDVTTSSTNGLLLSGSGTANFGAFINYGTYLSDWWVVGTEGDVLMVLYIK